MTRAIPAAWVAAAAACGPGAKALAMSRTYPSLSTVENALITTAKSDFEGKPGAFEAAAAWNGERLRASHQEEADARAPHLCCADFGRGREALSRLQELLSPEAVRRAAHSGEHGACFFATASHAEAETVLDDHDKFGVRSFAPFPSALKIAPGVLEHRDSSSSGRLGASHGKLMRKENVLGLSVELAPGTLPAHSSEGRSFISDLLGGLMSDSIDLHATNFWSDPAMAEGDHLATPGGASRAQHWSKAATVVHTLSDAASTSPGDVCSWNSVIVRHAGDDLLQMSGLDHLLHLGRGAGGTRQDGEAEELHVACFMGLISFLAGRLEVLRIAPRHRVDLLNASARATIQTATTTDTPLTDAGLDGTGQVIQVIDSGLDESSCYFAHDAEGDHVTHGYYYDELGFNYDFETISSRTNFPSSAYTSESYFHHVEEFSGGDFSVYTDRRKIIQYINMVKSDDTVGSHGSYFTSNRGDQFSWIPAEDFEGDDEAGHGTHTAGSAAGATLNDPAETVPCGDGETLSCVGGCIDDNPYYASRTDDLITSYYATLYDIDRLCPLFSDFGCDDTEWTQCLGDDVSETLTSNGGMAQGAKLAIFDVFYGDAGLTDTVGNGLWEPCAEADCKVHSNSWGADLGCMLGSNDVLYDEFMYENSENLLVFAAGNAGEITHSTCTMGSPAIAKNVLAVGATVSGDTRWSDTQYRHGDDVDELNIDTVAWFSSTGPTVDGRIKPEVMAPGDKVYSAASDGLEDVHSCRLYSFEGTSMSCPIVAGAAAMVRQYFMDESFYATDMTARGFCDAWSGCEAFSPSSATVKALLINSANLMGGDSEPNGVRGFGRIHLENGMPLAGEGDLACFVADASYTFIPELTRVEYNFDVDADGGLDFRATLSWIDPPASTMSTIQLVHDLDLAVISPSGTRYTMWASGVTDTANVNERVVVDAADVESGTWSVWVWAKNLSTDEQSYSLVVNGAISPATGEGAIERSSASVSSSDWTSSASPGDPQIGEGASGVSPVSRPTCWSVFLWLMCGVLAPIMAINRVTLL